MVLSTRPPSLQRKPALVLLVLLSIFWSKPLCVVHSFSSPQTTTTTTKSRTRRTGLALVKTRTLCPKTSMTELQMSSFTPNHHLAPLNHNPKKKNKKEGKSTFTSSSDHHHEFLTAQARQLLGIKQEAESSLSSATSVATTKATTATPKWKLHLQLMKPATWIPLSLMVTCGAAASGQFHWNQPADVGLAVLTMLLVGPCSEGFAQTINDWYDRDIDAVNEPYRPIPSGALTTTDVMQQLRIEFVGGLVLAWLLDATHMLGHGSTASLASMTTTEDVPVITTLTLLGYLLSYIYSAPPLKLKQNGWLGTLAIGLCYIALPWWCGQAVFSGGDTMLLTTPDWLIPLFASLAGTGCAIVNDFKSMRGDAQFGLDSLPLLLGPDRAAWLAAALPDVVQLGLAAYLWNENNPGLAAVVLAALVPQVYWQRTLLLEDPFANDVKYMALSQPFVTVSLFATAVAMGQQHQAAMLGGM